MFLLFALAMSSPARPLRMRSTYYPSLHRDPQPCSLPPTNRARLPFQSLRRRAGPALYNPSSPPPCSFLLPPPPRPPRSAALGRRRHSGSLPRRGDHAPPGGGLIIYGHHRAGDHSGILSSLQRSACRSATLAEWIGAGCLRRAAIVLCVGLLRLAASPCRRRGPASRSVRRAAGVTWVQAVVTLRRRSPMARGLPGLCGCLVPRLPLHYQHTTATRRFGLCEVDRRCTAVRSRAPSHRRYSDHSGPRRTLSSTTPFAPVNLCAAGRRRPGPGLRRRAGMEAENGEKGVR